MKNIFKFLFVTFIFAIILIGCDDPITLPEATHYGRVPKPVNLTATFDTSSTGKFRVYLNWSINSMDNIKDFEIYRKGLIAVFTRAGSSTQTAFVDSFSVSFKDSLVMSYYLVPNGKDKFIGEVSDTYSIVLRKVF